jgi:hypothetical protein
LRYFMSIYYSLPRFSNFLLTASLLMASSGWAMEGEGEPFQPGDEGYSSHVALRALDIAPASAAAAASHTPVDVPASAAAAAAVHPASAAAAAAAPAAAAALDNDNNRGGGAAVEGFSPAVLGSFERDFPVASMRQWEAAFRDFDDIFKKFQLAVQRLGPFASTPLMNVERFQAWGASFAQRVESTTDFGPLEAEIHWVRQYLGSYARIQAIASGLDTTMLIHISEADNPISHAKEEVDFPDLMASDFLRKVGEYEKMLAKRKEALRDQNWAFPLRRDEFERRKGQCGPFETMRWFDLDSEYNWDRGGRVKAPASAVLFLYLTDDGKFEARPPVIDPGMPAPFSQQIVRESGYLPSSLGKRLSSGMLLEVEKIDGESYRYPSHAVGNLRKQMESEIRQRAFASEAYTLPCEYWELDGESGEPKEKMAGFEKYSKMTFSMFSMPGTRQLKVWPLESYYMPGVVLEFFNTILENPSADFPAANDPKFTNHTFELTCHGAEIVHARLCSEPQYRRGAGRDRYARRTLTKSAAQIKQDILALKARMVASLKQRFPGAWENEEEGAGAAPAAAAAAAAAAGAAVEPGAGRRDDGRYEEKKGDK